VCREVSPYTYELELPASIRIHRVHPVSLLDLVVGDSVEGQVLLPPPPVDVDGEEEYQVLRVEDSWMYRNQLQYLIRWSGYDSLTWEPAKLVDWRTVVHGRTHATKVLAKRKRHNKSTTTRAIRKRTVVIDP